MLRNAETIRNTTQKLSLTNTNNAAGDATPKIIRNAIKENSITRSKNIEILENAANSEGVEDTEDAILTKSPAKRECIDWLNAVEQLDKDTL
jgi:hypothetical protein